MFIFFAYLFSLLTIILAFKLHDKYDPARYFMLLWGGQIIFIHLFFHNLFSFTGYGLVFITLTSLLFCFGTLTGQLVGSSVKETTHSFVFKEKRGVLFLQLGILLAFINVLHGIYSNGFSVFQLFSFRTLLELNSVAAENRYAGVDAGSLLSQVTLIFVYLAPLFAGYLLPLVERPKKIWCYLSIFPALFISLTQSVKLGFITSIALFAIGVLVSSYANNDSFFKMRFKTILKVFIYVVLFLVILFISMMFRTGKFDWETISEIGVKFVTYAFGHLPAFDSWFSTNVGDIEPTGGLKTFYGITNYLGIAERKQGVFPEFTFFAKNDFRHLPPELGTNVYTLFRFILEDFGFLGSFLIMFLTGMLSGYSWLMIKKQKNSQLFQTILVAILFFLVMSFATSVWVYTSYIASVVLLYILLRLSFSPKPASTVASNV